MPSWSNLIHDPSTTLLALLFVGHVFADFLVQTPRVAGEKRNRIGRLLQHGLLTCLTHLFFLVPFWTLALILGVVALSIAHVLVDALRARVASSCHKPLFAFLVDQALHAATLLTLWGVLTSVDAHVQGWIRSDAVWLPELTRYLVIAAGFVFNAKGGTVIVRMLLKRYPYVVPDPADSDEGEYAMGRTIGCLERFLLFTLVLLGQWGALGFVFAAKSVARFRELESQRFADYYLIGTLGSILVAIGTGILVRALVFA